MAKNNLVKHFIKVEDYGFQQVSVMRASNVPGLRDFEFPICVMSSQLDNSNAIRLAHEIVDALNNK